MRCGETGYGRRCREAWERNVFVSCCRKRSNDGHGPQAAQASTVREEAAIRWGCRSGNTVHAGFPSPAEDYSEGTLDLNRLVVRHPEATFFARVEGDSMKDEGIGEGDILVVDKAVAPYDGCLAVACVDGEFTLKRVRMEPGRILLVPANPRYRVVEITPENEFLGLGRGALCGEKV